MKKGKISKILFGSVAALTTVALASVTVVSCSSQQANFQPQMKVTVNGQNVMNYPLVSISSSRTLVFSLKNTPQNASVVWKYYAKNAKTNNPEWVSISSQTGISIGNNEIANVAFNSNSTQLTVTFNSLSKQKTLCAFPSIEAIASYNNQTETLQYNSATKSVSIFNYDVSYNNQKIVNNTVTNSSGNDTQLVYSFDLPIQNINLTNYEIGFAYYENAKNNFINFFSSNSKSNSGSFQLSTKTKNNSPTTIKINYSWVNNQLILTIPKNTTIQIPNLELIITPNEKMNPLLTTVLTAIYNSIQVNS